MHGLDIFREGYQQLYEEAMTSLDSTMFARQRIDQLEAELNEHRGTLGKLETYEEDAKNSKLNLLVRFGVKGLLRLQAHTSTQGELKQSRE